MAAAATITGRIISVGDELLVGRTSDTNATWIQRALLAYGVEVRDVLVVGDHSEEIAAALSRTEPGDLVFLCGGLGATADDLTRDALATWADAPLTHRADVAAALDERRRQRGLPDLAGPDPLALVPAGCEPIANPVGAAPGLVGSLRGRRVVVLPGVPQELRALLPPVLAALRRLDALPEARPSLLWRTAQVAESVVARLSEPVRRRHLDLRWSWWLVPWGVDVCVRAEPARAGALAGVQNELDDLLGDVVYAREMIELPGLVQDLMLARGATLAVAESCTGGLLGAAITAQAGSSGYFRGGIIGYADTVKRGLLAVAPQTLAAAGAVSRDVAEQMATAARQQLGADYGLAVTGIAGPGGGTSTKPVGTTWLALAGPNGSLAGCYRFSGDRERNRQLAAAGALDALRRALNGLPVFPVERLSWGRPQ